MSFKLRGIESNLLCEYRGEGLRGGWGRGGGRGEGGWREGWIGELGGRDWGGRDWGGRGWGGWEGRVTELPYNLPALPYFPFPTPSLLPPTYPLGVWEAED